MTTAYERERDNVLRDPCMRKQLAAAIRAFDQMDPLDAAIDAEYLFDLMRRREEAVLQSAGCMGR